MNDMQGGTVADAGSMAGQTTERPVALDAVDTGGASTGSAIDPTSDAGSDTGATAAAQADAQTVGQAGAQADAQGAARYFPHVHASLLRAESASHDAGTRIMAQAYEDQRLVGVAALETMIAHAQLALAAVKWEPENHGVIIEYLVQARRCLAGASDAIEARLQLADLEGRHQVARDAAISTQQA